MSLTTEEVAARRKAAANVRKVTFRVGSLYGLSKESVALPLNRTESIESGQVCITIDPEADPAANVGLIDYEQKKLTVRYGAQIVFPGLFELISTRRHEPSLLNPIRATATDECTVTPDLTGFRALGCLDFLPGSLWSGASGG